MKRRLLVAVLVATSLLTSSTALARHSRHHQSASGAAQGGDPNKGDIWVDNVGQPPGPGHEMDPHLACTDINLWGAKLADSSGTYTIDGWPPSGLKKVAYSSTTWHYNTAAGGTQVLDVINITTLINNAAANGDTPQPNQGYHFKIQFTQDPQKHKTFWVRCGAPTSPGSKPPPLQPPGTQQPPKPGGGTNGQTTSPNGVNVQAPSSATPVTHKKNKKGKIKVLAKRLRHRAGFTG
jgi:hypothetical protein